MIYLLLGLLMVCSTINAAVIKVTCATSVTKRGILFSDQHRGTQDFIDMKHLDDVQREPLWHFFKKLTLDKEPTLFLLELSRSERKKLGAMNRFSFEKLSFRKQLGYHLVQGKSRWGSVTVDTWDERDQAHRNVSWALANTIDMVAQLYQKKYGCTAETTCVAWFDEHAARDFFSEAHPDSFHHEVKEAVKAALLGHRLTEEQQKMGFWSVAPISIADYQAALKRYEQYLQELTAKHQVPDEIIQELKQRYTSSLATIDTLTDAYRKSGMPYGEIINGVILYHLLQQQSLQTFEDAIYKPFSVMSVVLGDITLLSRAAQAFATYNRVVISAGGNHMEMVEKYVQKRGFTLDSHEVIELSNENPAAFATLLMKCMDGRGH